MDGATELLRRVAFVDAVQQPLRRGKAQTIVKLLSSHPWLEVYIANGYCTVA